MRRHLAMVALVLGLCACGSAPETSSMAAYLAAVDAGDAAACAAIGEPALRGECEAFVARRLAETEGLAAADPVCAHIAHPTWQGECWFLVADAVDAVGAEAIELCSRAGRQQSPCQDHAMGRETKPILAEHLPEHVQAAEEALVAAYEPWMSQERRRPAARSLIARDLAARGRDEPFDPKHCGDGAPDLCAAVYDARLRFDLASKEHREGKLAMGEVCSSGANLAVVEAQGFSTWTPEGEELAILAWKGHCR